MISQTNPAGILESPQSRTQPIQWREQVHKKLRIITENLRK